MGAYLSFYSAYTMIVVGSFVSCFSVLILCLGACPRKTEAAAGKEGDCAGCVHAHTLT